MSNYHKKLIGPGELAERLGVSVAHVRNLTARGDIPYLPVSRIAKRFVYEDVIEALQKLHTEEEVASE